MEWHRVSALHALAIQRRERARARSLGAKAKTHMAAFVEIGESPAYVRSLCALDEKLFRRKRGKKPLAGRMGEANGVDGVPQTPCPTGGGG